MTAMKVGYARFTKDDQDTSQQLNALEQAGCKRVFVDRVNTVQKEFPGLETTLAYMQEGDTLVVKSLDRLGRSLKHLVDTVNRLGEWGYGFQSLQEEIDTNSGEDGLVLHIFGALAEFETTLARKRTRAGLKAARARGRLGGRPRALDEKKRELLFQLYDERKHTVQEICGIIGVSKSTIYSYLGERTGVP